MEEETPRFKVQGSGLNPERKEEGFCTCEVWVRRVAAMAQDGLSTERIGGVICL